MNQCLPARHYVSYKYKSPIPEILTDRARNKTQQSTRGSESRKSLCGFFERNSKKYGLPTTREASRKELVEPALTFKEWNKEYKSYLLDKQLSRQLTTRNLNSMLNKNKKGTIQSVIKDMDQDKSPTTESMKIADYLLNSKNYKRAQTGKEMDVITEQFTPKPGEPQKIVHFSRQIMKFASNLTEYLKENTKNH